MAAEQEERAIKFLASENVFRRRAFMIIDEMIKWSTSRTEESRSSNEQPAVLVDEVLHSIFFLGKINQPSYSPDEIVSDTEMFEDLKQTFPRPFEHYSCQLPKRSPFSCVLDMIAYLTGERNENQIKEKLKSFKSKLVRCGEEKHLISSTMCVSQKTENSKRYYGVSMSTYGAIAGQIMIAASCLSYWDDYVAGAVMTYYPNNAKKKYFDGTIKLPETVRCKASSLSGEGNELLPCRSCGDLFGFLKHEENRWVYGNCAEVESVSNMFKNEEEIKEKARPASNTYTDQNKQKAKRSMLANLKDLLTRVNFKWDKKLYPNINLDPNVQRLLNSVFR